MNKHKSNKIKENSYTVRHLIMGQIIITQNLVAIKEVRHAGQPHATCPIVRNDICWQQIHSPRGGYSLYVGWYGCAAVLTPFFDILGIELDFWGYFFSSTNTKLSFGVLELPMLTKFHLFGLKFHFCLDLFGSNFQRPAAHPHQSPRVIVTVRKWQKT